MAAQAIEDSFEMIDQEVGEVEETKVIATRHWVQLREAGVDGLSPVVVRGMGAVKLSSHEPDVRRSSRSITWSTDGSMRSTITFTPATLGWMPSSWLSLGSIT